MLADEQGASAIEYGMIAGLIVIGLLVGITAFADANDRNYEILENELTT
ncbi:MAG: Flp family type IVb pilin [Hyphomonas sp.]|nr:Flp family type IVb pilin [Hyphomonas sp.]MBU3921186.1 Flp family type IVb pilin [Alphaproteobacteria bacterium]MBU4062804.1 Flp family type IVb pilin [Alphaproteobacteria bacterium]MBU4163723.1 Flp family type IVb pilin [Alphaproteobacteria bacterium]MBU4569114.1 Flp family type IVb pilin [Alphaproteobacteria bacterium]